MNVVYLYANELTYSNIRYSTTQAISNSLTGGH